MTGLEAARMQVNNSGVIADNMSSSVGETMILIENAHVQPSVSLGSLLGIQRVQSQIRTAPSTSGSCVINVEEQLATNGAPQNLPIYDHTHHQITTTDNFLNNIREAASEVAGESQDNSNSLQENPAETVQISLETQSFLLKIFQKYMSFISILLIKAVYDYRAGILNIIVLLFTFSHANSVLKREIAKQQNKSRTTLFIITCYIIACIAFVNFKFEKHLFLTYTQPLSVWELLWSILITDFILKLITIILKIILTCVPINFLALQKRGKYYLMIEATSQLYRCITPIRPWLYYLFEAYQGPEKILGVFLSVLYTVSKGSDVLSCMKLFRNAAWKLLENVNLGMSPSTEQCIASGGICAICHEEYSVPVKLHCKHIFCETCVFTWLDRERTCPLCRTAITDDPVYRDGHTTHFVQLY